MTIGKPEAGWNGLTVPVREGGPTGSLQTAPYAETHRLSWQFPHKRGKLCGGGERTSGLNAAKEGNMQTPVDCKRSGGGAWEGFKKHGMARSG